MPTLITYATLRGSTAEIAERIATVLKSKGITVDTLPIDQVSKEKLSKYTSVIVGSAVINFSWIASATSFLQKNTSTLSNLPVWAFSTGCPNTVPKRFEEAWHAKEEPELLEQDVRKEVKNLRDHVLFLGRSLKGHFGIPWRIFWGCFGGTYGDFRDWDAIERWADKVGDEILTLDGTVTVG
jgi:menaquinone-dependent protoporphyrinogen oxidase